jgi:hypothetical protein
MKTIPQPENNHSYWAGSNEKYPINKRVDALIDKGLSEIQASLIKKKLESIAWPRHSMLPGRLCIPPPPSPVYSSSFRETNIGNDRDIDSSVMWKASKSLEAAMSSLVNELREFDEDLFIQFDMAIQDDRDPVEVILEHFNIYLSFVWIYHPIIVIDSQLWVTTGDDLERIQWCRFVEHNTFGHHGWWFDVVNSSYFSEFANYLTNYYCNEYRKRKVTVSK